jgi:hypothetical protein
LREAAELALDTFGKSDRGAILEIGSDELHPDRQTSREWPAGAMVAGRWQVVAGSTHT